MEILAASTALPTEQEKKETKARIIRDIKDRKKKQLDRDSRDQAITEEGDTLPSFRSNNKG